MKRRLSIFLICLVLIQNLGINSQSIENKDYMTEMKQDILVIMIAYPDDVVGVEQVGENVYILMKSGNKIIYDDKVKKSNEEKLDNPDVQDMLEQYYPLKKEDKIMDKEFNPGRVRHYKMLNEVYGSNKASIEKNLKPLTYGYTNYQFNSKNNAVMSLDMALNELIQLAKIHNDIGGILYPASGTYNYRVISGTGRLSPHSYGIAIDLKSDKRDYWKWSKEKEGEERIKEYPKELVEVFEKNNFIWGGKWGYFDILHFEYRPEIILKAKYFTNSSDSKHWYEGVPINENNQKLIEIIDDAIKD